MPRTLSLRKQKQPMHMNAAFRLWSKQRQKELTIRKKGRKLTTMEVITRISEEWIKLPEADKQRWLEEAAYEHQGAAQTIAATGLSATPATALLPIQLMAPTSFETATTTHGGLTTVAKTVAETSISSAASSLEPGVTRPVPMPADCMGLLESSAETDSTSTSAISSMSESTSPLPITENSARSRSTARIPRTASFSASSTLGSSLMPVYSPMIGGCVLQQSPGTQLSLMPVYSPMIGGCVLQQSPGTQLSLRYAQQQHHQEHQQAAAQGQLLHSQHLYHHQVQEQQTHFSHNHQQQYQAPQFLNLAQVAGVAGGAGGEHGGPTYILLQAPGTASAQVAMNK